MEVSFPTSPSSLVRALRGPGVSVLRDIGAFGTSNLRVEKPKAKLAEVRGGYV